MGAGVQREGSRVETDDPYIVARPSSLFRAKRFGQGKFVPTVSFLTPFVASPPLGPVDRQDWRALTGWPTRAGADQTDGTPCRRETDGPQSQPARSAWPTGIVLARTLRSPTASPHGESLADGPRPRSRTQNQGVFSMRPAHRGGLPGASRRLAALGVCLPRLPGGGSLGQSALHLRWNLERFAALSAAVPPSQLPGPLRS